MQSWAGLIYLFGTIVIGMTIVSGVIFVSEKFGKQNGALLIAACVGGIVTMASVMSSAKFNLLQFGSVSFVIAGGSMFWATISLAQDYLNETYGAKMARLSMYGGFLGWFVGTVMLLWLLYFVPTPSGMVDLTNQAKNVLGLVARVNMAAFAAYFVSSWTNIWIFDRIKRATEGKTGIYLWFRTVISTGAAMLVDSLIFTFGAFVFVLPIAVVFNIIIANLVVKWTTSVVEIFWLQPLVNVKNKRKKV